MLISEREMEVLTFGYPRGVGDARPRAPIAEREMGFKRSEILPGGIPGGLEMSDIPGMSTCALKFNGDVGHPGDA